MNDRRFELSAWALLVTQVIHGLTPADTEAEGYMGLVGGLILLIATMAAILGFRRAKPWARRLLFVTGLTVAAGFVAYHATPVTSPITNPYIGEPAGLPAWTTVILTIAAALWASYESRPRPVDGAGAGAGPDAGATIS
jgi:hypothetical protein